jgi:hypothetical protein
VIFDRADIWSIDMRNVTLMIIAFGCTLASANVIAQPMMGPGGAFGPSERYMMGPGSMMGRGDYRDMCSPRAVGLAEWRIDRIERALKPNDAQKAKLDELRAASKKAAESLSQACPTSWPASTPERLSLMEKRLDVMHEALKTVKPAFEAFYASLDANQKSTLDGNRPRGWGWNWWRRN